MSCLLIDRPSALIEFPSQDQQHRHVQPWMTRGPFGETTRRATTAGSRRKDASLEGTSKASMASQARRVPSVAVSTGSVFSEKLEIRRNGITVVAPDPSQEPRADVDALRSCSRRLYCLMLRSVSPQRPHLQCSRRTERKNRALQTKEMLRLRYHSLGPAMVCTAMPKYCRIVPANL